MGYDLRSNRFPLSMHSLRPLAILLAIFTIPAVLGWGFATLIGALLLVPHHDTRWLAHLPLAATACGIILLGWTGLASLFWTARHFDAYISPTPRWVLAGYLLCALVFGLLLKDLAPGLASLRDAQSLLTYAGGPAGLLLLALWRLWRIRRFYATDIAELHQNSACAGAADGTLGAPTDHLAAPCSSDPPASSR